MKTLKIISCAHVCGKSAHQVHYHVLVEGGSPLSRHLADIDDGFRVVRIDVEDGSVDDSSDVSRVRR